MKTLDSKAINDRILAKLKTYPANSLSPRTVIAELSVGQDPEADLEAVDARITQALLHLLDHPPSKIEYVEIWTAAVRTAAQEAPDRPQRTSTSK